jgi:4-hydroxybutyrate CoA-transferase
MATRSSTRCTRQGSRLITWHVNGPLRSRVGDGVVEYVPGPSRARAAAPLSLERERRAGAGLAARSTRLPQPRTERELPTHRNSDGTIVIAEIDPDVPRTFGNWIHRSRITASIDSETPMPEYHAAAPDDTSTAIAAHVIDLLPERPTLQVGIGEIPEALVASLGDADLGPLRFVGMGTDEMVPLLESGAIDPDALVPDPGIATVELMGSRRLLDAADLHPAIGVYPSTRFHTPRHLLALDRLVSINSAVEIDLHGQVNAETVRGHQVSGVGGSIDFVEGAYGSDGGLRILALSSTTRDGRHSRIVPTLPAGAAVTIPRALADVVVSEYGVADLRGRTLRERADALVAIAHPDLRDDLANASAPPTEEPR